MLKADLDYFRIPMQFGPWYEMAKSTVMDKRELVYITCMHSIKIHCTYSTCML